MRDTHIRKSLASMDFVNYEDDDWELRHDADGFTYKILKRHRLLDPEIPYLWPQGRREAPEITKKEDSSLGSFVEHLAFNGTESLIGELVLQLQWYALANRDKELSERDITLVDDKQQIKNIKTKLDSGSAHHKLEKEALEINL